MDSNVSRKIEDPNKDDRHQLVKFEGEFDKPGHSSIKDQLEAFIKAFIKKLFSKGKWDQLLLLV